MSGIASVSFLARRASQRERVRILYRRALRDTLNWAVHRHLFYPDEDVETIDRLIADGEASYNKWRHPDPYIVPWAPGGSKFNRNPVPPEGIEIVYDYGKEEAELVHKVVGIQGELHPVLSSFLVIPSSFEQ
uniref:NADH dehydrogenase [ubiquinone] 1 beta subcomplex subunit 9 n=1 Tax=Solanum lycopersicum TaxID=4081 RepID=A0A3Q7ETU1_SOLLC